MWPQVRNIRFLFIHKRIRILKYKIENKLGQKAGRGSICDLVMLVAFTERFSINYVFKNK